MCLENSTLIGKRDADIVAYKLVGVTPYGLVCSWYHFEYEWYVGLHESRLGRANSRGQVHHGFHSYKHYQRPPGYFPDPRLFDDPKPQVIEVRIPVTADCYQGTFNEYSCYASNQLLVNSLDAVSCKTM